MEFLERLYNSRDRKDLKRFKQKVAEINNLEAKYSQMSNEELASMTINFKERLANGETLDDILADSFAVVREVSKRQIGKRQYDVQLIAGMVLHEGRVAQANTGEGKSLAAVAPLYLNALTGKGVHLVTVNDYLAKRDASDMRPIFSFLGMSVGCIIHDQNSAIRKAQYECDVTYGTNNEFGFDYLKDNMVIHPNQKVQRKLNYAVVDEVDSILIDEARTPLIISGPGETSTDLYKDVNVFITTLNSDDWEHDEKEKASSLTESGVLKAEQYFNLPNITSLENSELYHHINQALKAHVIMKKDKDYVVKDNEILIVDEFTGRIMYGRRFSDGLHQAIEAKEGVEIQKESKTMATITFQNYFRMYEKLSGMTGTAKTEEEEFRSIYKMDVFEIPTNKPNIRKDMPDLMFISKEAKIKAIIKAIHESYSKGQPVLVGTISVDKSEELYERLKATGIVANVLNAKYHEKEAEIVAQAGRFGAVTIATNMAGRGTDIILGGNPEFLTISAMKKKGYDIDTINRVSLTLDSSLYKNDEKLKVAHDDYVMIHNTFKESCAIEKEEVIKAGGLFIIGTERHDSRRIDNQLRGRAGRQGDPGKSEFYLSLEDDLMRLFGGTRHQKMFSKMSLGEESPLKHNMLSRSVANAQRKIEGKHFSMRKNVLEYDDVMNKQRHIIYDIRNEILYSNEGYKDKILKFIEMRVDDAIGTSSKNRNDLVNTLKYVFGDYISFDLALEKIGCHNKDGQIDSTIIKKYVLEDIMRAYNQKEENLGSERMRGLERLVMLDTIDRHWINHIDAMDQLRKGIGLRAVGQIDPVIAYKVEGFEMFEEMNKAIRADLVSVLFRVETETPLVSEAVDVEKLTSKSDMSIEENEKIYGKGLKVGRNDPCPCGSGKKYKKCCGKNS